MQSYLDYTFFKNTVYDYLIFFLVLLTSILVIKLVKRTIFRRIKAFVNKRRSGSDDFVSGSLSRTLMPILYFSAFYFSTKLLILSPDMIYWMNIITLAFMIIIIGTMITSITIYYSSRYVEKMTSGSNSKIVVKWTNGTLKVIIWSIGLVLFLDNIGIKITLLITGFGIGGIAIAFAAQAMLVDIFCFFSILFDKPFEIGDYISLGAQNGTVEYIGVKTTRIRSVDGEQIVISNSDLTSSRIKNYKTLVERRVTFKLGIPYETDLTKLKEIPEILKNIIESQEKVRFGRAHFAAYTAFCLEFEVVYFVLDNDYITYMDINQTINFLIKEQFEKKQIAFAYQIQVAQAQGSV